MSVEHGDGTRKSIALLVVQSSAGEIDWILPVANLLQERGHKVVTVFESPGAVASLQRNQTLFALWRRMCDAHYVASNKHLAPLRVLLKAMTHASARTAKQADHLRTRAAARMARRHARKLRGVLDVTFTKKWSVEVIFDQFGHESPLANALCREFGDPLVVRYPHSAHPFQGTIDPPGPGLPAPENSTGQIVMLSSSSDVPYWSQYFARSGIRVCGYPKYDKSWIDLLWQASPGAGSRGAADQGGPVFAIATRGPHRHYLQTADFEYLLRSVMDVVMTYDGATGRFKLHPRQNREETERILRDYPRGRWEISTSHPAVMARESDVFITLWSSTALDAAAVGTPVIEFWPVERCTYQQIQTPDGKWTTVYRLLGIAAGADTKEDLARHVASAIRDPRAEVWRDQARSFADQCRAIEFAAARAADLIIDEYESWNMTRAIGTSANYGRGQCSV